MLEGVWTGLYANAYFSALMGGLITFNRFPEKDSAEVI
jgi:hypothetical protein